MALPERPRPDSLWNEYMVTPRGADDLAVLFGVEDLGQPFRDRTLQALVAPNLRQLPFTVHIDSDRRNLLGEPLDFRGLFRDKENWAIRAAKLVGSHLGTLTRPRTDDEIRDRYHLQFFIPQLLPLLPPEEAEALFAHFQVDTKAVWDTGSRVASPYLLRRCYEDPELGEQWKRRVAGQMHKIIETDRFVPFAGATADRALDYGDELDLVVLETLLHEQLPVSVSFLRDEIEFLLSFETGQPILRSWKTTTKVVELVDDTVFGYRFLRRQFLPWNTDQPHPRLMDSAKLADNALNQIRPIYFEDKELVTSMDAQFDKVKELEELQKGQLRTRDSDIVERMRVPSS